MKEEVGVGSSSGQSNRGVCNYPGYASGPAYQRASSDARVWHMA